jgi:hypothetical protein
MTPALTLALCFPADSAEAANIPGPMAQSLIRPSPTGLLDSADHTDHYSHLPVANGLWVAAGQQ